tara:strand:- start:4699 stop:8184 length:3486 start_codon:yes stop_codon:yes gene_type:complete
MSQARNLSGFLAKVLASGDLTDSGVDAVKLGGKDSSYYLDYNNFTNAPAGGTDSATVSSIITADVDAAFINALTIDADTLGGQNSAYYLNYNNLGNQPNILDSTNISSIITADVDSAYVQARQTSGGSSSTFDLEASNRANYGWHADLSSATNTGTTIFGFSGQATFNGIFWSTDGNYLFEVDGNTDIVRGVPVPTSFDISSVTSPYNTGNEIDTSSENSYTEDLWFSPDGLRLVILGSSGSTDHAVHTYTLTSPWDLTTATYDSKTININSTGGGGVAGIHLSPDGRKIFIASNSTNKVHEYTLSTAYDVSTATETRTLDISSQTGGVSGIRFNHQGTQMFISDSSNGIIVYQYQLALPFNVSSASYVTSHTGSSGSGAGKGLAFSPDGAYLHTVGNGRVYEITLTGNVSYATPVVSKDVLAYDSNLQDFVDAFTLPTSDGSTNQVLVTNGSGTISFADQSGGVDSTEARGLISVTDLGGDGSLTYTAGTGILTYTGPSATEVRAHFSAGTGVTVSSGQISIGQSVGTTDNVTFNDMIVSGDLTVSGTTTTVNSNTVHIGDNIISLNHDETGTPSQDAGIEIERGTSTNKTLVWNETTDKWTVGSETFVAGMFEGSVAATTLTADSATLGAVEGFSHLKAPHSATTKTYTVTVASKTSAHRYNGTGSGNGFVIDGMEAPFLTLTPGRTYRFDQADATNSGHPLRFYYDVAKNDSYTANITTAGTAGSAGAYTEITVTDTTPLVLHYQCSAHGNMGNAVQTNARNLTGFTSDDLAEGSSNFYYTDARVTTLVDSAYVQARQTSGGGGGGTDSAATIALITSTVDSAYVALREADAGGGGGSALTIQDEGVSLSTAATTLNFTGTAVTASGTGATKTINITGGGGVNVAASYVEDYSTTIYTATAGLTTFNASSSPALPAYTAGKIGVFVNGVKRTDFTATDGTSVVMTNALSLNDHVEIINFGGPLRSAQDPLTETKFTATAGQTTFALNYTAGHITVFLNGAKLSADDYTATNGTSVVLTTGAALNDVVEVIEHGVAFATPYSAANYTKGVSGNVSGNIVSSLNYTPGKEAVYLNGIKLLSGDDYTTVDSGSSITFINNIVDSDRIEVVDHGIVTEATLGLDSAATINLIDSDYVSARAGSGSGGVTTGKAIAMAIVFGG